MVATEIGESIVGSYLRHVRGCELVSYNQFTGDGQGEVDVIGTPGVGGPDLWLCEVATHINGLSYGGFEQNKKKIRAKINTAFKYAAVHFPGHRHHFELWSPYVSKGQLTTWMREVEREFAEENRGVRFVVNDDYAHAVAELYEMAKHNPSATGEEAFRMLQILARIRGAKVTINLDDSAS